MPLPRHVRAVPSQLQLLCNACHVARRALEAPHWVLGVVLVEGGVEHIHMDGGPACLQRAASGRAEFVHVVAVQQHALQGQGVKVGGHHFRGVIVQVKVGPPIVIQQQEEEVGRSKGSCRMDWLG